MRRINLKYFIVIFTLIVALLCMSCSREDVETATNGKTITFTDALGRKVSIVEKPQRVAALIGSFSDIWVLSGGELCASADDAWSDFGLELHGAVNIGGAHSPNLELLISSAPSFVIASASTASNVDMKDSLEDMGITVAYFDVDNFEDYLHMLDICTDITGRKDLYEKNGLTVKSQIDSIKCQYRTSVIDDKSRRVLLLRAASSFVKAKGSSGTVIGEMLSDIGCVNIADDDSSLLEDLSIEEIIRQEPYHIFIVTMGNDTDAAKKCLEDMINENPAWSTLVAVKNGRLHFMDKKLFNLKPNARWAESYGILYEKLIEK